jgi:hypothetical protein
MSEVVRVLRKDIDEQKWNNCIDNAANGLPYAYTWYLDSVAENWDGVIYNDYEAVMPCPWYKKGLFQILYQPHYCQQGGVFSVNKIIPQLYHDFLLTVKKKYTLRHIQLNPEAKPLAPIFRLYERTNLVLPLSTSFSKLKKTFATNHTRNINKAKKANLRFAEWNELKSFQEFYAKNVNLEKEPLSPIHFTLFNTLTQKLTSIGRSTIYVAFDETETPMAAVLLIPHGKRLIALVNTSSSDGKKVGAAHFLYASLIEKFAESEFLFDFEGSSAPSIARFYEGFGAINEPFFVWEPRMVTRLRQLFVKNTRP